MKRFLLVAATAAVILSGCAEGAPSASRTTETTPAPERAVGEMGAQLAENYGSIAALTRGADLILVGGVSAIHPKSYGNLPFTDVIVVPTRTLKGTPLTSVTVLETGGLLPANPKVPQAVPGAPIPFSFEGVPVMGVGERYVLFLRRYQGPITDDAWVVAGVVQGKFAVGGDDVVRFAGPQAVLNSPLLAAIREANLLSLNELLRRIQAAE